MAAGPFGEDFEHFLATSHTVSASASNEALSPTSQSIDVSKWNNVSLWIYVVGDNASSSGDIAVTYQTSLDGTNWITQSDITVTVSGTSFPTDSDVQTKLDVTGVNYIKLLDVSSTDATYTATLNAAIAPESRY